MTGHPRRHARRARRRSVPGDLLRGGRAASRPRRGHRRRGRAPAARSAWTTISRRCSRPSPRCPELQHPKARRTTGAARPPAPPATPRRPPRRRPCRPPPTPATPRRRHARSSAGRHARSSARRHAGARARRHASPPSTSARASTARDDATGGGSRAGLAVALVAGLGGWFVADRVAGDPDSAPPRDEGARRRPRAPEGLAATGSRRGGRRRCRAARGAGLDARPAPATTVSVALLPADHPALVPAALVAQAAGGLLPRARDRNGGRAAGAQPIAAWSSGGTILDVYAIPTTRGVLTLVCTGAAPAEAPTRCLDGLEQITVAGRAALRPGCRARRTGCGRRRSCRGSTPCACASATRCAGRAGPQSRSAPRAGAAARPRGGRRGAGAVRAARSAPEQVVLRCAIRLAPTARWASPPTCSRGGHGPGRARR